MNTQIINPEKLEAELDEAMKKTVSLELGQDVVACLCYAAWQSYQALPEGLRESIGKRFLVAGVILLVDGGGGEFGPETRKFIEPKL